MQLESIPQRFRQEIWVRIDGEIIDSSNWSDFVDGYPFCVQFFTEDNLGRIMYLYKFLILEQFHDEIGSDGPAACRNFFKEFNGELGELSSGSNTH